VKLGCVHKALLRNNRADAIRSATSLARRGSTVNVQWTPISLLDHVQAADLVAFGRLARL